MKLGLFMVLLCAGSMAHGTQQVALGCKRLRIVLDPQLTPDVVKREWQSGNPRSEAPAMLELVGCNGQNLARLTLAAPLARLDPMPIRGAAVPTYLVSADLTVEAGSYNGPLTIPVQVVRDELVPAVAQMANAQAGPVQLTASVKSAWQRRAGRNADELLSVSCQPVDGGFVTFYRRYTPSSQPWALKSRSRPGFWESDGTFPSRRLFP